MPKIWVGQTTLKGDKKEDGLSIKHLQVMLLLPARDASPSQGYPLSSMSPIPIYTPGWREAKWSKVPCLREQCDGQGVNPRPQDPEFDVLTTRPHTPPHVIWVYKLIRIKALIKHFLWLWSVYVQCSYHRKWKFNKLHTFSLVILEVCKPLKHACWYPLKRYVLCCGKNHINSIQ